MSINRWINEMWCLRTAEYYPAVKRTSLPTHGSTPWISEALWVWRKTTQRGTHCTVPFAWNSQETERGYQDRMTGPTSGVVGEGVGPGGQKEWNWPAGVRIHSAVYFKWVLFTACKVYLNKVDFKSKHWFHCVFAKLASCRSVLITTSMGILAILCMRWSRLYACQFFKSC